MARYVQHCDACLEPITGRGAFNFEARSAFHIHCLPPRAELAPPPSWAVKNLFELPPMRQTVAAEFVDAPPALARYALVPENELAELREKAWKYDELCR